jgi:hypothetical protein
MILRTAARSSEVRLTSREAKFSSRYLMDLVCWMRKEEGETGKGKGGSDCQCHGHEKT